MTTPNTFGIINQIPYLRTSRMFPMEIGDLSVELNTMYNEIATYTNLKTIGLFPVNRFAITGENWYITNNQKQQSLRRVYNIIDGPSPIRIPHGIPFNSFTNLLRLFGSFFDGTYYQTLPCVDTINVSNQISLKIDDINIIITKGAAAPAIMLGSVVLEWLSIT